MPDSPVLFIIFNRPETTQKVFDAIREAKPSKIYVAADGPRKENIDDEIKCLQSRNVIKQIDWHCEIKKLYRNENLGCFKAVSEAINWFFKEEEMGIILEDDCLPSSSFFPFCEELLIKYRNDSNVVAITGTNLGYDLQGEYSYTFSRIMNIWGWASWRRSAEIIDYELNEWKQVKHKLLWSYFHLRQNFFDTDLHWYKYWTQRFNLLIAGADKPTWDWQWIYFQISKKKLSVIPKVNLVTNIGFSEDATHTFDNSNPAANMERFDLNFPLNHPVKKKADMFYEEKFLKWVLFYHKRLPSLFYLKHYLKKLFVRH